MPACPSPAPPVRPPAAWPAPRVVFVSLALYVHVVEPKPARLLVETIMLIAFITLIWCHSVSFFPDLKKTRSPCHPMLRAIHLQCTNKAQSSSSQRKKPNPASQQAGQSARQLPSQQPQPAGHPASHSQLASKPPRKTKKQNKSAQPANHWVWWDHYSHTFTALAQVAPAPPVTAPSNDEVETTSNVAPALTLRVHS